MKVLGIPIHPPPKKNSDVYFSQGSSLLFQAKCGICGLDTMEGFSAGVGVGELLLAGLVQKPTMFLFHLFFGFPICKQPGTASCSNCFPLSRFRVMKTMKGSHAQRAAEDGIFIFSGP